MPREVSSAGRARHDQVCSYCGATPEVAVESRLTEPWRFWSRQNVWCCPRTACMLVFMTARKLTGLDPTR